MTEDQALLQPELGSPSSPLSLRDARPPHVRRLLLSVIAGAALLAILADGLLLVSALGEPQTVGAARV